MLVFLPALSFSTQNLDMHAVPWFVRPKVYKPPEVCAFRQVASPKTRGKLVGKSDWEVVQRAFSPFNSESVMYPNAGEQGCYQPFDMPMAHIEYHDDGATIDNTELMVVSQSTPRRDTSCLLAEDRQG